MNQRCGDCVWYEKPWSGPSYGFCRWLEHHSAKLPMWVMKASCSMGMKHGGECATFERKIVEIRRVDDVSNNQGSII